MTAMRALAPRRATASPGFTLVEMLIALALLGLITAMLFGSMRFGARATAAANAINDRTAQLALAYDFLQAELSNAQTLSAASGGNASRFEGAPDHVAFIALPPPYLQLGAFYVLHVGLDGPEHDRRLTVRWEAMPRADDSDTPDATALRPAILLDGVASVAFAYFGADEQGQTPDWHDEWTATTGLPSAVRMTISFADGQTAPALVFAPRLALPPAEPLAPNPGAVHF